MLESNETSMFESVTRNVRFMLPAGFIIPVLYIKRISLREFKFKQRACYTFLQVGTLIVITQRVTMLDNFAYFSAYRQF